MIEIPDDDRAGLDACAEAYQKMRAQIARVIISQEDVIEQLLISLLSDGHALIVGVPGLAKTLLVSTMARVTDLAFGRIQFTPDLMPSDITGNDVLEENPETGRRGFRFVSGPIFTNILLADEINRTPPKTQAALLQAMQEREVTFGDGTYSLDPPFLVLATQNPIEQEGTYPLPEAQLDRFMLQIDITYPNLEDEVLIVEQTTGNLERAVDPVIRRPDILKIQRLVRRVPVARHVVEAAVRLVRITRPREPGSPPFVHHLVRWGAGVRASQFLILASKARALLHGRPTPLMSDLQSVAAAVLTHRIVPSFRAEAEGVDSRDIVNRIIDESGVFDS